MTGPHPYRARPASRRACARLHGADGWPAAPFAHHERTRAAVAAFAGSGAAALGHLLDTSGRLPLVHESADVRLAMHPVEVAVWLVLAAGCAVLAISTRPLPVGAPAAVAIAATPELWGRHDPGALLAPGALLGGLLQLLILLVVAAAAVAAARTPPRLQLPQPPSMGATRPPHTSQRVPVTQFVVTYRPRGPPIRLTTRVTSMLLSPRGPSCPVDIAAAGWRLCWWCLWL